MRGEYKYSKAIKKILFLKYCWDSLTEIKSLDSTLYLTNLRYLMHIHRNIQVKSKEEDWIFVCYLLPSYLLELAILISIKLDLHCFFHPSSRNSNSWNTIQNINNRIFTQFNFIEVQHKIYWIYCHTWKYDWIYLTETSVGEESCPIHSWTWSEDLSNEISTLIKEFSRLSDSKLLANVVDKP